MGVVVDQIATRAAKRDARERGQRMRVCMRCKRPADKVLGIVYSELPCERCKCKPCHGVMLAGVGEPGPPQAPIR